MSAANDRPAPGVTPTPSLAPASVAAPPAEPPRTPLATPAPSPVDGIFLGSGQGRMVASPGNPPDTRMTALDHVATVGRPPSSDVPWHGLGTVGNEPASAIPADDELHGNPGAPVRAATIR